MNRTSVQLDQEFGTCEGLWVITSQCQRTHIIASRTVEVDQESRAWGLTACGDRHTAPSKTAQVYSLRGYYDAFAENFYQRTGDWNVCPTVRNVNGAIIPVHGTRSSSIKSVASRSHSIPARTTEDRLALLHNSDTAIHRYQMVRIHTGC